MGRPGAELQGRPGSEGGPVWKVQCGSAEGLAWGSFSVGVQRRAVCKLPLNPEDIYWDVIGLELAFSSLPEERGYFVDNHGAGVT